MVSAALTEAIRNITEGGWSEDMGYASVSTEAIAALRELLPKDLQVVTLNEARAEVREGRKQQHGIACPCCGQMAKVYNRTIHATMAKCLIDAYFQFGVSREFRPIEVFGKDSPDFIKLRHWGLLLEVDPDEVRDDGSPRTGRWMLSTKAAGFIREVTTVPKYAVIYNGNLLGTEGEQVSIRDCLVRKFNYEDLMDGR